LGASAAIESHLSVSRTSRPKRAPRPHGERASWPHETRSPRGSSPTPARAAIERSSRRSGLSPTTTSTAAWKATAPCAAPSRRVRIVDGSSRPALLALLQSEARYDVARLRREPDLRDALLFEDLAADITEQPYLAGHEDLLRARLSTRVSRPLLALQATRESVFAARGLTGPRAGAGVAEDSLEDRRREQEASLPRSGIDQLGVSAGAIVSAAPHRPRARAQRRAL
jgi:hypothetical protein